MVCALQVFLKTNSRFDIETRKGSPMDVTDLQRAGVKPFVYDFG
jgi:hypothetical protein